MPHLRAPTLLLFLLSALGLGLLGRHLAVRTPAEPAVATYGAETVFLAGDLSPEGLVTLLANLAAAGCPAPVLLDTPTAAPGNRRFVEAYRPGRIVPVGAFADGVRNLEARIGMAADPAMAWSAGGHTALLERLFPRAERVVVCPAGCRRLLLHAACLAGVLHAPLRLVHAGAAGADDLNRSLHAWHVRTVYAAGDAANRCRGLGGVRVIALPTERAVAAAYLRRQLRGGPVRSLVLANPADDGRGCTELSPLAPWVALRHRAALVLTDEDGRNAGAVVRAAVRDPRLRDVDNLVLVADLDAIPMERRPNPIASGKDPYIEMEPLTPRGREPFSFAMGRIFHRDRGVVGLMLARPRLIGRDRPPRNALVVSNPTGSLPLLETISRNTARELANGGFRTTTLAGAGVSRDDLRRMLPDQDVFLWEGHYNTLVKDFGIPDWPEPLRPSLIFLQSCLALSEVRAAPFIERGAVGVVGTSTRTFAGTGGACSLAFFDALLYEGRPLGDALRQAKNFLLAYSLLKKKRLGDDARLTGANLRSAWAFSLWGDPALRFPRPPEAGQGLPAVRHRVQGDTVVITLPATPHERTSVSRFRAQMLPNGRLGGLLARSPTDARRLIPFVFAEIPLPHGPSGARPRLSSGLPSRSWVFCWDRRRRCGYLLAIPRLRDRGELRFHVRWETCRRAPSAAVARGGIPAAPRR